MFVRKYSIKAEKESDIVFPLTQALSASEKDGIRGVAVNRKLEIFLFRVFVLL